MVISEETVRSWSSKILNAPLAHLANWGDIHGRTQIHQQSRSYSAECPYPACPESDEMPNCTIWRSSCPLQRSHWGLRVHLQHPLVLIRNSDSHYASKLLSNLVYVDAGLSIRTWQHHCSSLGQLIVESGASALWAHERKWWMVRSEREQRVAHSGLSRWKV